MRRILIVDDEAPLAEALTMLFETESIAAASANDRDAAEALIRDEFFPVILADVRLHSDEDGLRLLQSIRALSPRSKVASLTGYATPALERQLRDLGAELVLYKPVEFEELLRAVRELLDRDDVEEQIDADTLYEEVRPVLYAVAIRRFGMSPADAEDVIQQAWCLFVEKRSLIREPRAWLVGTVANLCRQELQRNRRNVFVEPEVLETIEDARARGREETLAMREALARVDDRTRRLCCLIAIENLSYQEVSTRLGLPLGSIGPLYIRAKAKLRALL